jgi:amidase
MTDSVWPDWCEKKEVKPSELVEEAISRIEKLNPRINAVIHKMYDLAREAAEGDYLRFF